MAQITRYHKPTKYDVYEIGTICKSLKDIPEENDVSCFRKHLEEEDKFDLYIQLNKNKNCPKWKPIGEFFSKVFGDKLNDEEFINEALRLYQSTTDNSFLALAKLLKKPNKDN